MQNEGIKNEMIEMNGDIQSTDFVEQMFPIVEIPEYELQNYKKVSVSALAALGSGFAQLPTSVRTVMVKGEAEKGLYRAINVKGAPGDIYTNASGLINGNIVNKDTGKISGRLQFQQYNGTLESSFVMPFNPALLVAAVAIMEVDKKLDKIQSSVEDVLKYLELDKQAKQRGNLRKLMEIAEDYKQKCTDVEFCRSRNIVVQNIQTEAMQNIEFYSEKIHRAVKEQKLVHSSKGTSIMTDEIARAMAEYQLACYIYSYCGYLDTMLRMDFESSSIDSVVSKINRIAERYNELYLECCTQVGTSQGTTINNRIVRGVGHAFKDFGEAISSIPVIKEGMMDERLIEASAKVEQVNEDMIRARTGMLDTFEDNRTSSFVDSLALINSMYNANNSLLTDGSNVYIQAV